MDKLIVFAPSELDYKARKCQRCYYLEKVNKISPKSFPPPVFSNFDVVQQAYFKDKDTSDFIDNFPSGRIMNKEELPGRIVSKILKDNKDREFILGGRPDIVIEFKDKSYGIIDFKTTNLSEEKGDAYKFQLEAYNQIFTNPGSTKSAETPKLSPITHLGVLQFFPKKIHKHKKNECDLRMLTQYSPITRNEQNFFDHITNLIDLLDTKKIPEFTESCNFCNFVNQQYNIGV